MLNSLLLLVLAAAQAAPKAETMPGLMRTEQTTADLGRLGDAVGHAAIGSLKLQALTPVELKVLEEVSSKTAVSGMPVRLALAHPLYFSPELGIPEGTEVEGVVIHAAKAGMGGKSGELLIGAKLIRLGDNMAIPLRSFRLGPAKGRNNETLAFATAVTVGLPALLINGGSARIPAGAIANAKTSSDVEIPAALLTKLPPLPAVATTPAPLTPAAATQANSTGETK